MTSFASSADFFGPTRFRSEAHSRWLSQTLRCPSHFHPLQHPIYRLHSRTMNRSSAIYQERPVVRFHVTPLMHQTIDERLELDFRGSYSRPQDLSFSSPPVSPDTSSSDKKIALDAKLQKVVGSPSKRDELDCSNHQRRQISPQNSLSDLDESNHSSRWLE